MYYRLYSVGCCWSSLTRVRFNMCRHDMQQPGMGSRDGRLPRPGLAVNSEKAPRPALSISAPLMEPDGCVGAYVRLPLWQPLQMWNGWHPFLSSLFILYPRYGRTPLPSAGVALRTSSFPCSGLPEREETLHPASLQLFIRHRKIANSVVSVCLSAGHEYSVTVAKVANI